MFMDNLTMHHGVFEFNIISEKSKQLERILFDNYSTLMLDDLLDDLESGSLQ